MKKKILALIAASLLLLTTACSKKDEVKYYEDGKGLAKEDIKVGFVYIGDIHDGGYTQAHDYGRLEIEKMGIETKYIENVTEEATAVNSAIENLINGGCNVIYTNSYGYGPFTKEMAKKYPDILFGHATGDEYTDNMTTYMGKVEEPRYLAGIVAGLETKVDKIGYVAAMGIPEVKRGINAFALGVKSVNPDAVIEVVWTDTWYDVNKEKQAAQSLLTAGCDVIAQHQDSTAAQVAAEEAGALAIGYNKSTADAAPKAYLTAPLFHWEVFYKADIQAIIDGNWKGQKYWAGMKEGMTSLDDITDLASAETKAAVEEAKAKILDGSLKIFAGPIVSNEGKEVVAEGAVMADDELWFTDFLVDNVKSNS